MVSAGANPKAIKFSFEGAKKVTLNGQGELVLQTAAGEVKQHKPVIYQEVNGARQAVAGEYVMQADQQIGFAVGAYDATKPLVIDPIISWASYVGGQSSASAATITADKSGNVYLVVWDGPTPTAGAYDSGSGYSVMKVNASGTAVIWTARIGASSFDRAHGIALDKDNNVYLTGAASSSQYPTTPGAFQSDYGLTCSACRNAFVTKLSADGSQLVYSTFLKGDQITNGANSKLIQGNALTVDIQGNAYVTGETNVKDFPITPNAFQPLFNTDYEPARDAFVTKLNPTGSAVIYSTYLNSAGVDIGTGIVVDGQGNAFVTGQTGDGYADLSRPRKTPFPKTPSAYQTTDVSPGGAFVTKLNTSGSSLLYSTVIGSISSSFSYPYIEVDTAGNAYITSDTQSRTFPTTPGAFQPVANQDSSVFVTKLNPTGSALVYSTFLGGNGGEYARGLSLDLEGNATVVGGTSSTDFPQTDPPPADAASDGLPGAV